MLKQLPRDLIKTITIQTLSYEQIIEACRDTGSEIFFLCNDKSFWIDKLEYDMTELNLDVNQMLIDSCKKNRLKYVIILISTFNADPAYNDNASIKIVSKKGYTDILEFLLTKDVDVEEGIKISLYNGYADSIRIYYHHGLLKKYDMNDIFLDASTNGKTELVKFLIEEANVDPNYTHSGINAIENASLEGNVDIVKYLLKYKQSVSHKNEGIISASKNGHTEIVKLLMEDKRVNPSIGNNEAVNFASSKGHSDVVKLLLTDKRVKVSDKALGIVINNNELRTMKILLSDKIRDYAKILSGIHTKGKPSKDMLNLILGYIEGNVTKEVLKNEEILYQKMMNYWNLKDIGNTLYSKLNMSEIETNENFFKKNKSLQILSNERYNDEIIVKGNIKDFVSVYFLNIRAYLEVYSDWMKIIFQVNSKSNVFIVEIVEKVREREWLMMI